MAIVPAYPFNLLNGTIADATQVMADFDSVKNAVNANAAATGANSDITSLTGLTTPLSVAQGGSGTATPGSGVAGTIGGYRNLLRRNGGFEVWQRGPTGAGINVPASSGGGVYIADGWYMTTGVGQASQAFAIPGLINGSQTAAGIYRNSGQTGVGAMVLGFPLDTDEIYPMLGQYVRLSFTAKKEANFSPASSALSVFLYVGTGTPVRVAAGYTGAVAAITAVVNLTSTATLYQFNSAAIIPVTTRQAEVQFSWTPVGTAGAVDAWDIDDVQLEIVPAATGYVSSGFERLNFGEQLLLCQRHYQKTFSYNVAPIQNVGADSGEVVASAGKAGASFVFIPIRMQVPMRVAPSMGAYNPRVGGAAAQIYDETAGADGAGATVVAITPNSGRVQGTGAAGTAVGNILGIHVTMDAGI